MRTEQPLMNPVDPSGAPQTQTPKGQFRVLVVEDDASVAEGVRLLLEGSCETAVVDSGARALELIDQGEEFDAILCDLMMPRMDGIQLHHLIAEQRPGLERCMVFMTGGAFTHEAEEFLGQSETLHIEKPFDLEGLQRVLRLARARGRLS